jgi:hypothetical protein
MEMDNEAFFRMGESLRLKGFRHLDMYTWLYDNYHRWIRVDVLNDEYAELNFFDEERFIASFDEISKGLEYFGDYD